MADQKIQFVLDEDGPMQTDSIYLPSVEDIETQYPRSDRDLTKNHDKCWLKQVLIHPNDPTDTVQVTIPTYDVDLPTLSH